MNQSERATEEIDSGGNDRRADAVVVDDERLDQIVEMALVIGDVDDPPAPRRFLRDADVLVDALDLPRIG